MADIPSPEQIGTAAAWFNSEAGITATVLAVVAMLEAAALVAGVLWCRRSIKDVNEAWVKTVTELSNLWSARIDQMRTDVKDAFSQNDAIADKMVDAMHGVEKEIARMSGRRERD